MELNCQTPLQRRLDKIPYHTHHKTDSILLGIDEHVRFMADE